MPLDQELKHFHSIKADLLRSHEGKFALIKGEEFVGAFDNAANAYQEGVHRFGKEVFLVKRITEKEEVFRNQALSRVDECPSLASFSGRKIAAICYSPKAQSFRLKSAYQRHLKNSASARTSRFHNP